jgi:hypothetical protein
MLHMCVYCILISSRITLSRSWKMDPSFLGASVITSIRARSESNTHSKHLKIVTMFIVTLSVTPHVMKTLIKFLKTHLTPKVRTNQVTKV